MKINHFAIGVDIEKVKKFQKLQENRDFLSKVFSKKELAYCLSKKIPEQHLAARFAAKEAVVKAMSSLKLKRINWSQIEILKKNTGEPYLKLPVKNINSKISLSHDQDQAIAFVVLINNQKNDKRINKSNN